MKTLGLTLLTIGLALAAFPASAQGQTTFTLETHSEGAGGYFTLEGQTAKNPTLNVAPGQSITVTIKGTDDGVHNFCVGSDCSEYVTAAGETQTLTFTAPTTNGEYYCQPHRSGGMVGTLSVGGATTTTPAENGENGGGNDSPGFGLVGVLIALAGVALVVSRARR